MPVLVDLNKVSGVIKNDVVKKAKSELEKKIPGTSGLAKKLITILKSAK